MRLYYVFLKIAAPILLIYNVWFLRFYYPCLLANSEWLIMSFCYFYFYIFISCIIIPCVVAFVFGFPQKLKRNSNKKWEEPKTKIIMHTRDDNTIHFIEQNHKFLSPTKTKKKDYYWDKLIEKRFSFRYFFVVLRLFLVVINRLTLFYGPIKQEKTNPNYLCIIQKIFCFDFLFGLLVIYIDISMFTNNWCTSIDNNEKNAFLPHHKYLKY